jgi:hypothetical protein
MRSRAASLRRSSLGTVERLFHDLDNSLTALGLIVDVLRSDSTCMWAQGDGLNAMAKTLAGVRLTVRKLKSVGHDGPDKFQVSRPVARDAAVRVTKRKRRPTPA